MACVSFDQDEASVVRRVQFYQSPKKTIRYIFSVTYDESRAKHTVPKSFLSLQKIFSDFF